MKEEIPKEEIYKGIKFENVFTGKDISDDEDFKRDIYNISIKNEKLRNLFMTFKENKIFYANDMVGTDFKQVIDFQIRR